MPGQIEAMLGIELPPDAGGPGRPAEVTEEPRDPSSPAERRRPIIVDFDKPEAGGGMGFLPTANRIVVGSADDGHTVCVIGDGSYNPPACAGLGPSVGFACIREHEDAGARGHVGSHSWWP